MLNEQAFKRFLRECVMFYPYQENRLNTFAEIQSFEAFTDNTLQCRFEDYQAGDFWARDWVGSGASREDMAAQFDALTYYKESTIVENHVSNVVLNLFSPLQTDESTEWQRTANSAYQALFAHGLYILSQLREAYTNVVQPGGLEVIGTQAYMDWLVAQGEVDSYSPLSPIDAQVLNIREAKVQKMSFEDMGYPELCGAFIELSVRFCPPELGENSFFVVGNDQKGVTR